MDKIWANRILAGTRRLSDIANEERKQQVIAELTRRLEAKIITQDQYDRAVNPEEPTEPQL